MAGRSDRTTSKDKMRCCFGCCCCCGKTSEPFNGVRVVHINGHVEGFDAPICAGEVTGKPPYQLLFLPIQLLAGIAKPLRHDDPLDPGRFYFLLPHTALKAAPSDLAALATRLTAMARRSANATPVKGVRPAISQTAEQRGLPDDQPRPSRSKPWRPVLATIRELSFRLTMEGRESMKSPVVSRV
ncbi:hypothetical protein KSP39_PZI002493 [Platanthera zijinensis]|uniref:Uncharacterized protein n=1 Tax=Platanthera zijinensis TaxID=2320716 RepID=A0AAP0GEZ8_9ASPA